jgi:catechol 2,3-dioxygenase-like lactoylglutathione lyase family enzyme
MRTNSIMAQLIVADLEPSISFYTATFGRDPDARPMDGLAEWEFVGAGAIQVFEEPPRAGKSGVTISVSSLDEQLAVLDAAHISHGAPMDATYVRLCTLADPDGNRIVFTEPLRN